MYILNVNIVTCLATLAARNIPFKMLPSSGVSTMILFCSVHASFLTFS